MFQMDSNSGGPFFGVDLIPSRKSAKTSSPNVKDSEGSVIRVAEQSPPANYGHSLRRTAPPVKIPEPGVLERLKLKRGPEKISLNLPLAQEDADLGPTDQFR